MPFQLDKSESLKFSIEIVDYDPSNESERIVAVFNETEHELGSNQLQKWIASKFYSGEVTLNEGAGTIELHVTTILQPPKPDVISQKTEYSIEEAPASSVSRSNYFSFVCLLCTYL